MDIVKEFKELVAQYCEVAADDMTDDMRFREDLGFTSLGFMSFLGELEDNFDVELAPLQSNYPYTTCSERSRSGSYYW